MKKCYVCLCVCIHCNIQSFIAKYFLLKPDLMALDVARNGNYCFDSIGHKLIIRTFYGVTYDILMMKFATLTFMV